ncbi:hypothetical protein BSKO_05260 [Bryopsis sp. KO-2023]|nr:hypothetical protein BSKO_05260 [Bryopsis sp. KO-2023]
MAAQLAAAAVGANTKPLLGDKEEEGKMDPVSKFKTWFCSNPLANLPMLLLGVAGFFCIIWAALNQSYLAVAIVGFAALAGGGYQLWALRNLAAEVDTFSKENEKLEHTANRLGHEVEFLGTKKDELTSHVTKLEGTVGELKSVSEGLQSELEQFGAVQASLEKFAADAGGGLEEILGNATKLQNKLQTQAAQNEKALLGKIAQDLEFLDQDVGMSKVEFADFMGRVPTHLQARFNERGLTFEKVAGDDGVIDFMEIEQMISTLMEENSNKLAGVTVQT